MKKTIIVFSNPFGYGPTGNSIPILESFSQFRDVEVIFAGSGLCLEILPSKYKSVVLNERDESEIENFLKTIENPYVIGVQNRFSIRVCRKNNIPCAFVDVLAWFWKKIPEDHLFADETFWINFEKMEEKKEYNENIHLVSGILEKENPSSKEIKKGVKDTTNLLVHIGGAKYPVVDGIPRNYLKLISLSLNALANRNIFKNICFVSGNESVKYIKSLGLNEKIKAESLSREKYLESLNNSNHLLTTAGVSSTLEGFYFDIPVSFILPINLSQLALIKLLEDRNLKTQKLNWADYIKINPDLEQLTEKEGIEEIEKYSKSIMKNDVLLNKYLLDFINMAQKIPNIKSQKIFINKIGTSGATEISYILKEKWKLT